MSLPKPHILFRFHKSFDVCTQTVNLLRKLNPDVPIHGMYGGQGGLDSLPEDFAAMFDTLFALPFEDPHYNWMHGDICIRWWYKEQGYKHDFTHLAVAEWDMLYLKPLHEIYNGFEDGVNYASMCGSYKKMLDEGWPWIQGRYQSALETLLEDIHKEKHVDIEALSFAIFGGCVLSRRFLNEYSRRVVRSLSNDEVRHSLYAALHSTGHSWIKP